MKYTDLFEEAKNEMFEEKKIVAKNKIKERLSEIERTESILKEMKTHLESLLEKEV